MVGAWQGWVTLTVFDRLVACLANDVSPVLPGTGLATLVGLIRSLSGCGP
jgi:hypothetical protein